MQFEMTRFGQTRGLLRYMEVQTLLWNVISSTYKAHKMYAYFDTVLDKGCFQRAFLPPIYLQFMLKEANDM
jgi:hypothetical protein